MFCIVAFVVLSILGIFSASNRQLAREALDCVLRRVTLRPCNTGFDEKMKARLLGTVITRSEGAAMFLNRNFEILAWTFFILMLASSIWTVRGLYLFYTTGSCTTGGQEAFCVFDPNGATKQTSQVSSTCKVPSKDGKTGLTLDSVNTNDFPRMNAGNPTKIVMIACYACDYSRKAYPMIRDLVNRYNVDFTFLHYPVQEKTDESSRLGYCVYRQDPAKFWKLNDILFAADKSKLPDPAFINETVTSLGLDANKVQFCINDPATEQAVQKQMAEVLKTNFSGTPTVFVNGTPLVGPKPYRVYAISLEGLLYWLK